MEKRVIFLNKVICLVETTDFLVRERNLVASSQGAFDKGVGGLMYV
jgi:hypothetical protein